MNCVSALSAIELSNGGHIKTDNAFSRMDKFVLSLADGAHARIWAILSLETSSPRQIKRVLLNLNRLNFL